MADKKGLKVKTVKRKPGVKTKNNIQDKRNSKEYEDTESTSKMVSLTKVKQRTSGKAAFACKLRKIGDDKKKRTKKSTKKRTKLQLKKTKFIPNKQQKRKYDDEDETTSDDDSEIEADDNDNQKPNKNSNKKTTSEKPKLTAQVLIPRFRKPKPVNPSQERGVVFLSSIPHGFYEKEMRDYFKQFGKVTGVNIPRSKKTRKYKGYGFVEFLYPEVAKVVAETMNNHMMCNKVMKATYVPPEKQKPHFFKYVYPKTTLVQKRRMFLAEESYRERDESELIKLKEAGINNLLRATNKLKKMGIENYTFPVGGVEVDETV